MRFALILVVVCVLFLSLYIKIHQTQPYRISSESGYLSYHGIGRFTTDAHPASNWHTYYPVVQFASASTEQSIRDIYRSGGYFIQGSFTPLLPADQWMEEGCDCALYWDSRDNIFVFARHAYLYLMGALTRHNYTALKSSNVEAEVAKWLVLPDIAYRRSTVRKLKERSVQILTELSQKNQSYAVYGNKMIFAVN